MREDQQHYECTYIIHPGVEDAEVSTVTDALQAALQKAGVTILNGATIGRTRLAYPVEGQRYGTYATVEFRAVPHTLPTLQGTLKLVPNVLRYLITEKHAISQEEQGRLQKAKERMASRLRDRETDRGDRPGSRRPRPEQSRGPAKPKVELKDLDQKLDEILSAPTENV